MSCDRKKYSDYPELYRKIHAPYIYGSFVNPYLNMQSIVVDPKTGVRKAAYAAKYTIKFEKVKTVRDVFEEGLKHSRFNPCLGHRLKATEPYEWLTYQEVDERIQGFGTSLMRIIGREEDSDNCVGIYGRNSPEWIITQHGCAAFGFPIVPLYPTLGDEAMQHILTQTEIKILVSNSCAEAQQVLKNFQSFVKYCIIICEDDTLEELRSTYAPRVQLYSFTEFVKAGMTDPLPKPNPKPTDLYMICYTSGSTGTPKGVLIEHEQMTSALLSMIESADGKASCKNTVHLSYLPLAHVMEQLFSAAVLIEGARIGFLTSTVDGLVGDMEALKPTTITAVPRVLSRIYAKYQQGLGNSALKKCLFNHLLKVKLSEQKRGKFNHKSLLDTLCFKKLRQALGGHVCCLIYGGAPLAPEMLRFVRAAFCGPIIEGYGSTETCGVTAATFVGEYRTDILGAITIGIEVKLADVPDLDLVALRDNRGEICVRGLRCTKGYYKDPEKTAELIDKDGWLHTGDIAEWTPEGALRIVDRLKSIFKLAQGEYVAPEKVELAYMNCNLVEQILVEGNAFRYYAVAVVVPNFAELRTALSQIKREGAANEYRHMSDEELCQNKEVKKFLLDKMNQVAAEKKLKGFEKVQALHLTSAKFSIENGLLTPTLKISRHKARAYFASTITALYDETDHARNSKRT